MKEKSIAKFKYENSTYKLLEITNENRGWDPVANTCFDTYTYMIVKNRRRIAQSRWEDTAKQKFMSIIAGDLLQKKITF